MQALSIALAIILALLFSSAGLYALYLDCCAADPDIRAAGVLRQERG